MDNPLSHVVTDEERATRRVALILYLWKRWAMHFNLYKEGVLHVNVSFDDGSTMNVDLMEFTDQALADWKAHVSMNPGESLN
jgi:hypothetical protein